MASEGALSGAAQPAAAVGSGPSGSVLVELPGQPPAVPWPTRRWPTAQPSAALREVVDAGFDPALSETYAVVVVQGGRLLVERYGGALPHFDGPAEPVTVD